MFPSDLCAVEMIMMIISVQFSFVLFFALLACMKKEKASSREMIDSVLFPNPIWLSIHKDSWNDYYILLYLSHLVAKTTPIFQSCLQLPSFSYAVRPRDLFSFRVCEPFACQRPTHVYHCRFKLSCETLVTFRCTKQVKQTVTYHATVLGIRVLLTSFNWF